MKKEECMSLINKYIYDINITNKKIDFFVRNKQNENEVMGVLGTDDRVEKMDYIEIYAVHKKDKVVLGKTTLLFVDKSEYDKVCFWEKKESFLKKITLKKYEECIGEMCIILAYTERNYCIEDMKEIKNIYFIVKYYLDMCEYILKKMQIFSIIETTGMFVLSEEKRAKECLLIDKDIEGKYLGKVFEESIVSEKMAKKLGFYEMKGLFHDITCGKIYFSKTKGGTKD